MSYAYGGANPELALGPEAPGPTDEELCGASGHTFYGGPPGTDPTCYCGTRTYPPLNLYLCKVSWVPGFVAGFQVRDEGVDRWALAGEMPTPWEAVFLAIERGMAARGSRATDG